MYFVGDVHADWQPFLKKIKNCKQPIVQVGDFGIGFGVNIEPEKLPDNFYFINGNHDNSAECRNYKNFLGRYGFNEELNIFYIGGGESIDKHLRTPGLDWWEDEQLNTLEANKALELYEKIKPAIVVSHEAPREQAEHLCHLHSTSWTCKILNEMLKINRPLRWIHGHYHKTFTQEIQGTIYHSLGILKVSKIER